jgi:hypothetical protein
MLDLNIKAIGGPYKLRGYMVVEGSHKTKPDADIFYIRFKDERLLVIHRDGTIREPK